MRGYDSTSYGDGFADVYDEWYSDVTDVDATVSRMLTLTGAGGTVLELGVGTGRLAGPMAAAGLRVTGIDSSAAMLERIAAQPGGDSVVAIHGDMVRDLPDGPFDSCLVAYNTLFNLLDQAEQRECFRVVAARLPPGGCFVVEAIVPDPTAPAGGDVSVRSIAADRVVLSVSDHRPHDQRTTGQFVELTEAGGVRLRPWAIRWAPPEELDAMATDAGFTLEERFADMAGNPYDEAADHHVSVYRI
ncbi:class I SAM-dependent DNA methyltransferase [Ilumatobacter nonamiensis]|uniref:class I SAM-dependent DNA methyltransferase n=1 Tax=Ilumatobacter nonamiensis TaxID=467093 RepID=UPI00058BDD59|nr:class I SAM-dependent methyltransferase [Ilumatobacter nonamiensis]